MGTPEVGIPIGTAGDGCWLNSSQSGDTWRGATHKKLAPIYLSQVKLCFVTTPRLIRLTVILCEQNDNDIFEYRKTILGCVYGCSLT